MINHRLWSCAALVGVLAGVSQAAESEVAAEYAEHVFEAYEEAVDEARDLQEAVHAFLDVPSEATLTAAREAWLEAREPYGKTEVFRFYGGPIDGVGLDAGWPAEVEGPEGRVNAWPLNEAYIDAVEGKPEAGIVNDPDIAITRQTLVEKNAAEDEADVTTGWHAIEFLLWGQDRSATGPGDRPASDFAESPENERRRTYLRVVTDLLVEDLATLADAWSPERTGNYRAAFVAQTDAEALSKILTGMATLSAFELASERIAVALDSGDQEDEHSCFSDNTHRDFVANLQGIESVYADVVAGPLAMADPGLAKELQGVIVGNVARAEALPTPIDAALASPKGSPERKQMEALVEGLYRQGELLVKASEALGAEAVIAGE